MNNSEDIMYSKDALITKFMLIKDFNGTKLIIEDLKKEYIYENIFKRLLGEKYNISSILGVGGKNKVIDCFNEFGPINENKTKNFFLVDGDFDRYTNPNKMIKNPNFIYLKTYNIENYFVDEHATIQFFKGYLKCLDEEISDKLDFSNWKNNIINQSSNLFLSYCFVKKYYPYLPSVSKAIAKYIDINTGYVIENSVKQYQESLEEIDKEIKSKVNEIKNNYIEINGNNFFNLICGKYLLNSFFWYIRLNLFKNFDSKNFNWYLISNFDISKLDYIKDSILRQLE